MSNPLVSIVVPTYNRDRWIAEAIESALRQTWSNLEVLVVDDGSTDETSRIVGALARRDERVRCFPQENRGVSAARNRAIAEARGSFIAFLDSDDAWQPWKLDVQMQFFAARPQLVMCWTDMEAIDPKGQSVFPTYLRRMYSAYERVPNGWPFAAVERLGDVLPQASESLRDVRCGSGRIYSDMLRGNLVHTSTVVLRRDTVREIGWFDESMRRGGEDFKFHLTTCRLGDVALLDVPSIRYRVGDDDRITHPRNSVHFARSFLRTISDELHAHHSVIDLPAREMNRILCEAHQWLAESELAASHRGSAAWHALRSMWFARSPRPGWKPLVKSLLPEGLIQKLKRVSRADNGAGTSASL